MLLLLLRLLSLALAPSTVLTALSPLCVAAFTTLDKSGDDDISPLEVLRVDSSDALLLWLRGDAADSESPDRASSALVERANSMIIARENGMGEEHILAVACRMGAVACVLQLLRHGSDHSVMGMAGLAVSDVLVFAALCCAVLCCAVLCCAVLCCAVLCCAVLCCAVLCCAVLCCAALCCERLFVWCLVRCSPSISPLGRVTPRSFEC